MLNPEVVGSIPFHDKIRTILTVCPYITIAIKNPTLNFNKRQLKYDIIHLYDKKVMKGNDKRYSLSKRIYWFNFMNDLQMTKNFKKKT